MISLFSGWSLFSPAPSYTYASGTSAVPATGGRDSGRRRQRGSTTSTAPQSTSPYDGDDVAAEDAELQEALRRSVMDTGGRVGADHGENGGGSADSGPSTWSGQGRNGVATVDAVPVTPSAPPEEDTNRTVRGGGDEIVAAELRRRRLQRFPQSVDL